MTRTARIGRVWGTAVLCAGLIGAVAATSGCAVYFVEEFLEDPAAGLKGATPAMATADQVVLAWDAPPGLVQSYRVYFRIHGETDWVLMEEIPAVPSPQYTVLHSTLGNGQFDFGVIAVYASDESAVHTSLDQTASPQTGWYLEWQH